MNFKLIVLLLLTGAFFACKRNDGNIIIQGQGDENQLSLNVEDTFTVWASTIDDPEDSTSSEAFSYMLLGSMNDPIFGHSSSSIYTDVDLFEGNNNFPIGTQADSAILFIPFISGINYYGNKLSKQTIQVYQLQNNLNVLANAYTYKSKPALNGSAVGTYNGSLFFTSKDSIKYKTGKIEHAAGLRVKLSANFANALMNMPANAYNSSAELSNYLKGFALIPENSGLNAGEGGFGIFDFPDAPKGTDLGYRPKIILYYRDTDNFVISLSKNSLNINPSRNINFSNPILTQLSNEKGNYPVTYTQALGGVKTWVRIPYLFNLLQDKNIVINKAELVFTVEDGTANNNYFEPPRLNIFKPVNGGSKANSIIADALQGAGIGGEFNQSSKTYTFNIARHLQSLINFKFRENGNANFGLFVSVPSDKPITGSRVVLQKPKLRIMYTRIK